MPQAKFLLPALFVCATMLSSCGSLPKQSAEPMAAMNTETNATGLWLPFGRPEAFLSTSQERALQAVKEYEKGVMRSRQVDYHYEVKETARGHQIVVHYGLGHVANEPILPGASMVYLVDSRGVVQKRTMG